MCAVVLFSLADQQYSLDVSHVQEVVRMVAMTRVPDAPPEILGAINVHGSATLVMDLRQRFGLPRKSPTPESPLLLIKSHGTAFAALVDRVVGVIRTEIKPNAAGLANIDNQLIVTLTPDSLLTEDVLPLLGRTEDNTPMPR